MTPQEQREMQFLDQQAAPLQQDLPSMGAAEIQFPLLSML